MYFKVDDLGQAYREVNIKIATGEIPSIVASSHAIIAPLTIKCLGASNDTKLQALGYTLKGKLSHLRSNYIDESLWTEFLIKCDSARTGREVLYKFKQKSDYDGEPRDNCLLYISYNKSFNIMTTVWRTTELCARWGADLILLSQLFRNLDLREINLVLLHAYQELNVFPGIHEMNEFKVKTNSGERYNELFALNKSRYFPKELNENNMYEKWRPIKLVQKHLIDYRKGVF